MTKRILIRPKASQDLDDHFAYIAERNGEAALQFFDNVRLTIAPLARMPQMGEYMSYKTLAYKDCESGLLGSLSDI